MLAPLPDNLPNVSRAKLPEIYLKAKGTLAECSRIDQCKDWADKAEALASYAKQAGDSTLRQMADRIQARAIRRCGELLQEVRAAKNQHDAKSRAGVGGDTGKRQAAEDAGLSRRQRFTAVRIANVPVKEFEAAVESSDPPTVTELAERGKRPRPLIDLKGIDPKEFEASTTIQGDLRRFAETVHDVDPCVIVRGAFDRERPRMMEHAMHIKRWLDALLLELERSL